MAEEEATASGPSVTQSEALHHPPPLPHSSPLSLITLYPNWIDLRQSESQQFLEVACKSSGKVRRFAAGTKAGFALYIITKKLEYGSQPGSFIEAVKEGEEPVTFGPDAALVDYGKGWKLQTAGESVGVKNGRVRPANNEFDSNKSLKGSYTEETTGQVVNAQYLGRIFLAFVFIFLLGAVFTLALENLPKLIIYINSNLM